MAEPLDVEIKPLSPAAFAPFGHVIGPSETDPSFLVAWARGSRLSYDTEEPTEVLFMEYIPVPLECDLVERHFRVTQGFIPLAESPSIMVVAAPTGPATIPDPESFCAFHVPGTVEIILRKGAWHAVTRFPVSASGGRFALLTGRETQRELEDSSRNGSRPTLTETVSLVERYGTKLRLIDLRA